MRLLSLRMPTRSLKLLSVSRTHPWKLESPSTVKLMTPATNSRRSSSKMNRRKKKTIKKTMRRRTRKRKTRRSELQFTFLSN